MAKKIRVHELAKELGLTSKEIQQLCDSLGIGVRAASSSIEDAQADRVRAKAEREGLIRSEPEVPEEPAPAVTEARVAEPVVEKPATTTPAPPVTETQSPTQRAAEAAIPEPAIPELAVFEPVSTAPAASEPLVKKPAPAEKPPEITSPEASPAIAASAATADQTVPADTSASPSSSDTVKSAAAAAKERLAPDRVPGTVKAPAEGRPRRVISSSGSVGPPRRVSEEIAQPAAPAPIQASPAAAVASATDIAKVSPPLGESTEMPAIRIAQPPAVGYSVPVPPGVPPTSSSGKPIPPPPGPPRSRSGRAVPPPPGSTASEGRRSTGATPGGRSGPVGGARHTGRGPGPGARPGAAPAGREGAARGGPRPSGGPRQAVPGAGGRPGASPGARGGPGGAQRRPPRRKSRRRRIREELQPMDVPTYTPRDAPVPEGEVVIERASTAQDLGPKLNRTAADVVRFLMQQGEMITATHSLSDDMIELFSAEVGALVRLVDPGEEQEVELRRLLEIAVESQPDDPIRPPVITVMGHVDHGKTLLLDRIRDANVVAGEAGGITQHIGAYQVAHSGHNITFIDTPGHEAFTAMRARGADSTDIVILVVAADDGVMPQTIEAINHAKAAEVPIVVAINKIDRDNADLQKAIAGVAEHGLVPEQWGGDTIFQQVSALQGVGLDELLDQLLILAEVEDLRANPDCRASGVVLEANLDIGRGPVATVLVQRGTLRVGDPMVAGAAWGRVRALLDHRGENLPEAGPATPVQVLGLSDVAVAGDDFVVAPSEKVAGRVASTREHWQRQSSFGRDGHALSSGARLEDIFDRIRLGETATLNLIVKADVNGSLEAVIQSLRKLERSEAKIGFVHRGVGGISENDIQLAAASNATIIGFNVRPDRKARELAETEQVEIRTYEIIYKLLEDIESAMIGMLAPEFEEVVTGDAEVREIFRIPRVGAVAGCYVQNGVITRGSRVRFLREGKIIWKGTVSSLKRFKEDTRTVASGFECGIGLSDFQDLQRGDVIETYEEREIARTLDG